MAETVVVGFLRFLMEDHRIFTDDQYTEDRRVPLQGTGWVVKHVMEVHQSETHMPIRLRQDIRQRLMSIEGQVRALQRMVLTDHTDADLAVQIHSIREALHQVERLVMGNHLNRCVSRAVLGEDANVVEDLMHAVEQYMR